MTRLSRLLLTFALALAAACNATPKYPPAWVGTEIGVPSDRVLWEVTAMSMKKEGYPVGSGLDPNGLKAVSGWRNDLAPFKGSGYRERAHVTFELTAPNRYNVNVRVEQETNEDIARPLDASYAEWKPAPDNEERAMILLQRIKSGVGSPLEVIGSER